MFDWLNTLIQAILSFIPRPIIVRATHGGVKWQFGYKVKELKPGWHWYWPLTTDVVVFVTARQTLHLPTQALITKDLKEVVVGGIVVYRIPDVLRAAAKVNWDVDTTIHDITQVAIVEVITHWNYVDLCNEISGKVKQHLTEVCRKELRQFGVYVQRAALTDFTTCRSYNVLGTGRTLPIPEEEKTT